VEGEGGREGFGDALLYDCLMIEIFKVGKKGETII
jgi:hypothetical protein